MIMAPDDNVTNFPEPQMRIRVTDDPDILEQYEAGTWTPGEAVMSHELWAALKKKAEAEGKSPEMLIRHIVTRAVRATP